MDSSRATSLLRPFYISLVLLLGFFILAALVASGHPSVLALNVHVMGLVLEARSSLATAALEAYTALGNPPVLAAFTAAASIGLILARRPIDGLFVGGATAMTAVASELIKALVASPRPEVEYLTKLPTSHSFPSGHTISFLVFVGAVLSVLLGESRFRSPATRWATVVAGSLSIVVMAYSRMYLGVHWLTDVAGSVLLGSAILSIAAGFWTRARAVRRGTGS